jgi:hypothetical protein
MTIHDPAVPALSVWVALESPTHHVPGVNGMMDLVAREVEGLPIAVERIPGRDGLGDSLVLRAGVDNGEKAVALMSHLDTVHPVGTSAKDLPVRVEGDRLYGPGVYDMKGGAWLALQAFKDAAKAGSARRPMVFLFTPDEEIGSPMTRGLIEDIGRRSRGRQDRHGAQGRRPFRGEDRGAPGPFGLAPCRWPQRDPRGGASDPRRRRHDRLFARHHHDGRAGRRRHRGECRAAACLVLGRLPRHHRGRWCADGTAHPRPQAA